MIGNLLKERKNTMAESVPGTVENPIHIGHTAEQQLKYATARERRVIHNPKPDPVAMFQELYEDVVRTGDWFPIGALERHAEGRLQQTYAALKLIEQAKAAGLLPDDAKFVATGAKVQDKRASKDYPAAHRLPADLSIQSDDGSLRRLTDYLSIDLNRIWVDQNIFAPTDRIHRLANVADQWVEDGGMKTAFVSAANAIAGGLKTAAEALEDIVQPGYAAAHAKAIEKVERNFSLIERQSISHRIVDHHGRPYREVPEPTALKIKGLEARAAAKDVMERTLRAYSQMEKLSLSLRAKSDLAVNGIIENELRYRELDEVTNEQKLRLERDTKLALDMVEMMLDKQKNLYLDPVTSFAWKHDGSGYNREITVFLEKGAIRDSLRIRGGHHFDSVDRIAKRLTDEYKSEFAWEFDNGRSAIEDGTFSGWYLGDENRLQLVVHIREIDRDMKPPEIEHIELDNSYGFSERATILTGNGIVQHATRSISSMSRDPDYLAAAYMAIAAGDAKGKFVPIQQGYPVERREGINGPEIASPEGKATFLAEGERHRGSVHSVLINNYGQSAQQIAEIADIVTDYTRDQMAGVYREPYISTSYSLSR